MRRRTLVAALATALLTDIPALADGGTATDQAVSLTFAATHWSSAPLADLTGVDGSGDPLFQSGWWYRAAGDTRESPLPLPDVELYYSGQVVATWPNLDGKGFRVEETTFVLDGEGPSGGIVSIVRVKNENGIPAEFTLFHYLDPDLAGTAQNDLGNRVTSQFLELNDGISLLAYRSAEASHHQVAAYPDLRNLLNDTAVTTLSDTGLPFGPADATAGFQFGPLTLAPGQERVLGRVSARFNPPRRHVKGDDDGLGLAMLFGQPPQPSPWDWGSQVMRRAAHLNFSSYWNTPVSACSPRGVDDFDGNYVDEMVYQDAATGVTYVGSTALTGAPTLPLNWKLSATGDFDADGKADILWRNTTSQKLVIWTMNGNTKVGSIVPSPDQAVAANWEVAAAADFNGDGHRDLLWYNQTSGKIVLWFMNASVVRLTGQFTNPATVGNNNWKVLAVGDYGKGPGGVYDTQDVVWQNDTSKKVVVWYMDLAGNRTSGTFSTPDTLFGGWTLVGPR